MEVDEGLLYHSAEKYEIRKKTVTNVTRLVDLRNCLWVSQIERVFRMLRVLK